MKDYYNILSTIFILPSKAIDSNSLKRIKRLFELKIIK